MMDTNALFGALTVYRERGIYLHRLEQFENAKMAFDEALKTNSADVRTLMGRSQVCADMARQLEAFNDAELALMLEPHNMTAQNIQARALYAMTDFERSVLMNSRGLRTRVQPPYFSEGINQGIETIQDCIGENAGPVMLDFLPLIKELERKKEDNKYETRKRLHVSRIPKLESLMKLTQKEASTEATLSRVLAMKYLGPMAYDKFFLQKLSKNPHIKSANKKGSEHLKELVDETLRSLTERQEMLRSQRPYYTIKFAEQSESQCQNRYKKEVLIRDREIGTRMAKQMLEKIEKCLSERRIMDLISEAERFQMFLDTKTPHSLPDKEDFIDCLYVVVGKGYLMQHRLSYVLSNEGNRRRIAFLMGLPVGRTKSFDSVIANYPHKVVNNVKHAIEKIKKDLEFCDNSNMRCWLYYEIANLLNKQKSYALAKYYAKCCQRQAQELRNEDWWLNGCFLLMKGDMQQGNINEVRIHVEEAYNWTCRLPDPENLRAFLATCLEVIAETDNSGEKQAVLAREKQILGVMGDHERMDVLFKRMWAVPAGRRFSVVPHKAVTGAVADRSERRQRHQRGLSIVPGPGQLIHKVPKSGILGLQIFDY